MHFYAGVSRCLHKYQWSEQVIKYHILLCYFCLTTRKICIKCTANVKPCILWQSSSSRYCWADNTLQYNFHHIRNSQVKSGYWWLMFTFCHSDKTSVWCTFGYEKWTDIAKPWNLWTHAEFGKWFKQEHI